jgi:uncharacterized repeat protein (TIGR01451 family)
MTSQRFAAALAALVVSLVVVASAMGDAADPIPSATHGSLVLHPDGSRTLTVSGGTDAVTDPGWQWTTHTGDCNTQRAGVGVAIVWNDPTDQGVNQTITGSTASGNVTVSPGTSTDNVVHPTPLTSPLTAVDIATPSDFANWRGGCGAYVNHTTPVTLPNGKTKTGSWNQGIWGPFSHTYPASVGGALSVCPLMYDVHGQAANTAPNNAQEVTAGGANHNTDNSLESNGSTPLGNGCFSIDIGSPHLSIVKEVSNNAGASYSKTVAVHAGDVVRYRFTVTNDGQIDLQNVHVNDLTGIADCDSSMTPASADIAVGQSATFTCDHTMGNADLTNTANATGSYVQPGAGSTDVTSADDSANVTVLPDAANPLIAIDKSGPATANAGDKVPYTLTVTNPGNVSFPEPVTVTDAQCNGAPVTLVSKNNDASPGALDPGDTWTYTCSVQTLVTDKSIHNVANVTAKDPAGTSATATDDATTALLAPGQVVLGTRIVPGRAQLLGPTGCASKAFSIRVRGTKIRSVKVTVDGKVIKRVKVLGSKTLKIRIDPSKLRVGVHRVVANVTFAKGSGTKPKTLRLSFQRCSKRLRAPRFTG